MSDLHHERDVSDVSRIQCDAVVLAGDIDSGIGGAIWAKHTFSNQAVVYVAGNHEFYHYAVPDVISGLATFAGNTSGFYFLENDEVIIDDVRFIGCTLWSDFMVLGGGKMAIAVEEASRRVNDYEVIRWEKERDSRKLTPADTILFHRRSLDFLTARLERPFDGATVVVTHYPPVPDCIAPQYRAHPLIAAFCSDLTWVIETYAPEVWVFGHIHARYDRVIGRTRVISNPRGYLPQRPVEDFDSRLILDV